MTSQTSRRHCPTCTCGLGLGPLEWCTTDELVVVQGAEEERFSCLRKGPGGEHLGPHQGRLVAGCCPNCTGLDTHLAVCPTPNLTTSDLETRDLEGFITWTGETFWVSQENLD